MKLGRRWGRWRRYFIFAMEKYLDAKKLSALRRERISIVGTLQTLRMQYILRTNTRIATITKKIIRLHKRMDSRKPITKVLVVIRKRLFSLCYYRNGSPYK